MNALQRALGAFYGLALGDALGMPTQSLSREQIQQRFGVIRTLDGRRPGPADCREHAPGLHYRRYRAGDPGGSPVGPGAGPDRSGGPGPEPDRVGGADAGQGSQDLLGPSTKRAIEMILAGESVEEAGRYGTTNGAAMRITPVGIAADVARPETFLQAVVEAAR